MKRTIFLITLVAFVATACNKSDISSVQNEKTGWNMVTLNASVDSELTKTAYADDTDFSWTTGDQISVLMNNGTENKFFTLTASSGGSASTTFSGPVLDGYDNFGSAEDGTKWALYPASDEHEFHNDWTESDSYKILFHVPSEIDLSTNFSANIPMKAIGDDGNNYSFSPIAAAFKLTFKVAAGINKVKLVVSRSSSYYLSGKFPFRNTDGGFIAFERRNSRGTEVGEISIIRNVETIGSDHIATFYLPYRIWQNLTPSIRLYNMDNGYTIYSATAKSAIQANDQTHIKIFPTADFTAKGLGSQYILGTGIDWSEVDMYTSDPEKEYFPGTAKVVAWKAKTDASNIYLFYKIPKTESRVKSDGYVVAAFDTDNDDSTGGSEKYGLGAGMEYYYYAYPFTNASGDPVTFRSGSSGAIYSWSGSAWDSTGNQVTTYGTLVGDYVYVEAVLPRSFIGSPASSSEIRFNAGLNSYPAGAQTITLY